MFCVCKGTKKSPITYMICHKKLERHSRISHTREPLFLHVGIGFPTRGNSLSFV